MILRGYGAYAWSRSSKHYCGRRKDDGEGEGSAMVVLGNHMVSPRISCPKAAG